MTSSRPRPSSSRRSSETTPSPVPSPKGGRGRRDLVPQFVPAPSERDFMATVREAATVTGWLVYHTHDSKRSPSGFPDLVLVRERVVFCELKATATRVTRDQTRWLEALSAAGVETYLWRPDDWHEIERVLGGRSSA
jgi:VRR-NUC domain